jgi:uncharacterized protein (TIGR03435 family)
MTWCFMRKLNFCKGIVLTSAAVVAITGPATISLINAPRGLAQQPVPPPPAFEVASVKPADPKPGEVLRMAEDPGRVNYVNLNLRDLLARAYGVKPYQIQGPSWIDSERYNITAKLPEGVSRDRIPAMLQALLAERFRMTVHRESREISVYALIVGKDGPKLKKSGENAAPKLSGASAGGGASRLQINGMTLGNLVNILSNILDRPVLDMTGIEGRYDFSLEVDAQDPAGTRALPAPEGVTSGSIFSSFRELGLNLEPRKAPFECIVVDKAERVPAEN